MMDTMDMTGDALGLNWEVAMIYCDVYEKRTLNK